MSARAFNARRLEAEVSGRSLGAVYTPAPLADWAAELLHGMMGRRRPLVLDPACGDGALLEAVKRRSSARVVGVDCSAEAIAGAAERLPGGQFYCVEGLEFLAKMAKSRTGPVPHGVIANPPWGAQLMLDRAELAALGYELTAGQVDSWDLFTEGILRAAKPGSAIVLILPDALFLPEHKPVRRLLSSRVTIEVLARLGEGFFPRVYRGAVVIAFKMQPPRDGHEITCFRLNPEARRDVLAGRATIAEIAEASSHKVPQRRYQIDREHRFDIDARINDGVKIEVLERERFPWGRWLHSGRGIELSKTGRVTRCPKCNLARPLPRAAAPANCGACGRQWGADETEVEVIVRANTGSERSGWHPLIVGEDVDRHSCAPSRSIRLGVPGIRYKPLEAFAPTKLLVRKTGVGIKAAVDESGSATNQVVFHYSLRPSAPEDLLDYLEGVLCSRVLLAWHLKRQGESEWRSHPYITQHLLKSFPIPVPKAESDVVQANAIARAVRKRRGVDGHGSPEDLEVERLVAAMFGFRRSDMAWVLGVLNAAEPLEPIRTLRLPDLDLVVPTRAPHRRRAFTPDYLERWNCGAS